MKHETYDVIVIGGGYAGVTAANRLPRGTRVLLVDPKPDFVHRVRLHEVAAGGNPRVLIPYRRMLKKQVQHRRDSVVQVEPGLVRLAAGGELRARHVLVTTGSDQGMANGITSYATASEVRAQFAHAAAGTEIEIRGAGLTGIELAAEIAYRRPELVVHLAGRAPVGAELPDRAKDYLRRTLERLGVQADSEAPEGSASVDARGVRRASLAHDSALEVSAGNEMLVLPTLEAVSGVWGAGDAVQVQGQAHLRASCATAIPMGAHAADNIARALRGEPARAFDFGYAIRCISLGRRSGLIVSVDGFDEPTGGFVAGVRAAWIKAAVTQGVLPACSTFARNYSWPASVVATV